MKNKTKQILSELESLDKTWVTKNIDFHHLYGRIPGEKEIRLWQVPRRSVKFLYFITTLLKPTTVLEIGTSAGYSAISMADAANCYGGIIDTIELFKPKISLAKKYIKKSQLNNINLIEGEASDITKSYDKKIDLLFLDADKENYLTYYNNLKKNFHIGTLIIADNAINYSHLMDDYLKFIKKNQKLDNYLLEFDNGLSLTLVRELDG